METDGDTWHVGRRAAARDSRRDVDLQISGWQVLRFTGNQVREQMEAYCVPAIEAAVDRLGGYGTSEIYPSIDLDNIVMCEAPPAYDLD